MVQILYEYNTRSDVIIAHWLWKHGNLRLESGECYHRPEITLKFKAVERPWAIASQELRAAIT